MSAPTAPTNTVPKPATSVSTLAKSNPGALASYQSDSESDGQARGGRRAARKNQFVVPLPTSTGLSEPAGQLLRGATDDAGKKKTAALLVGIKLDLEAEVHLTARVKGDICVGLY